MVGEGSHGHDCQEFVEFDPTGRYGRYNEILGKGASKIVYRGFDEYEGIEVAWNQVKISDLLRSSENLERLHSETHLLKTLRHKNIMRLYRSWVDMPKRNINFITEIFTSGTLRQYRQKHRRINMRAVKHWCRQILRGLLYLHSHDPPIIHRDLKCDNIFINGHQGEVKIGDLGLAAVLRRSHASHCVGTPEFMAPEVYDEQYNELVDIYSFGMCVLEMVTSDYPYSECTHPVEIYKRVITGTKPKALYRIKHPSLREFVEKCLASASERLSAKELLRDPFLQIDGHDNRGFHDPVIATRGISLFNNHKEDEPSVNVDITIKGKRGEDGSIFLWLRISDNEGCVRNIYFPFDIKADTAVSVATEMVAELDITDYGVSRIAAMIDGEVSSVVLDWKPGRASNARLPDHRASNCNGLKFATVHTESGGSHTSGMSSEGLTLSSETSREAYTDVGDSSTRTAKDCSDILTNGGTHAGSEISTMRRSNFLRRRLRRLAPIMLFHRQSRWSKPENQMDQGHSACNAGLLDHQALDCNGLPCRHFGQVSYPASGTDISVTEGGGSLTSGTSTESLTLSSEISRETYTDVDELSMRRAGDHNDVLIDDGARAGSEGLVIRCSNSHKQLRRRIRRLASVLLFHQQPRRSKPVYQMHQGHDAEHREDSDEFNTTLDFCYWNPNKKKEIQPSSPVSQINRKLKPVHQSPSFACHFAEFFRVAAMVREPRGGPSACED